MILFTCRCVCVNSSFCLSWSKVQKNQNFVSRLSPCNFLLVGRLSLGRLSLGRLSLGRLSLSRIFGRILGSAHNGGLTWRLTRIPSWVQIWVLGRLSLGGIFGRILGGAHTGGFTWRLTRIPSWKRSWVPRWIHL